MGVSLSRFPKGPRGGTPAGQGLNVGPWGAGRRCDCDGRWGGGPRPGLTALPFSLGALDTGPQSLPPVKTVVTVLRLFLCARLCAKGARVPVSFCRCCSVAQLRPTVCSPTDRSTPGFPVLYHPPELAQTRVH